MRILTKEYRAATWCSFSCLYQNFLIPLQKQTEGDMKVIENTTAYKCEFCGKTSLRRHNMVSHERACKRNPRNWAMCPNCANFDANYNDDERVEVSRRYSTWIGDREEKRPWYPHKCKCDGKMLFNRFHMNKDWVETLEEEGWKAMPNVLEGCPNRKAFSLDDILLEDIF